MWPASQFSGVAFFSSSHVISDNQANSLRNKAFSAAIVGLGFLGDDHNYLVTYQETAGLGVAKASD
jgi:hypothetical protein